MVSIITPLYNCQDYISDCIKSVLSQSYENWEMIIVDDKSTDNSLKIAKRFSKKDSRIKILTLKFNEGAGLARNLAIKESKGKYIAFLDSDDIWHKDKLEIQIGIMKKLNLSFSHTSYGYINKDGTFSKKTLKTSLKPVGYKNLLKRTEISCLTAVYDCHKLGKFYMPNIRRKQDYALWLEILKTGETSYPINKCLAYYRQRIGSSTSNKKKLILKHYFFLKKTQNLNTIDSIYYTLCWAANGIFRYYL